MTTYAQTPADLKVIVVQGDQLDIGFDASIDLTGYTFEAIVYSAESSTPGGWSGGDGVVVGDTAAEFSVNVVDLAEGQLNLGLSETQTSALSPANSYRWYLRWVDTDDVTRTAISGTFTVRVP